MGNKLNTPMNPTYALADDEYVMVVLSLRKFRIIMMMFGKGKQLEQQRRRGNSLQ
jgi:hypothetical protein